MSRDKFDQADLILSIYLVAGCLFKIVFPLVLFALAVKWLFA